MCGAERKLRGVEAISPEIELPVNNPDLPSKIKTVALMAVICIVGI